MRTISGSGMNGGNGGTGDGSLCGVASETPRIALLTCDCTGPGLARALHDRGAEIFELSLRSRMRGELERFRPDTVVAGLCREAPYRTLSQLRAREEELRDPLVLLLTPDLHYEMLSPYLEAGVEDVVNPPHSAAAILLRRYIHLHGPGKFDRDGSLKREMRLGSLMIDVPRRQVTGQEAELELSGREFELLLQLVEAEGSVVSRTELIRQIWGLDGGSEAVLDATVHRLRKKLDRAGEEGTRVSTVRGVGYQLDLASPVGAN